MAPKLPELWWISPHSNPHFTGRQSDALSKKHQLESQVGRHPLLGIWQEWSYERPFDSPLPSTASSLAGGSFHRSLVFYERSCPSLPGHIPFLNQSPGVLHCFSFGSTQTQKDRKTSGEESTELGWLPQHMVPEWIWPCRLDLCHL